MYYSSQETTTPTNSLAVFRVTFFMPRVCFKQITWYIEIHHVRSFILCVVMTFSYYVMFIHNMFVLLQRGNNFKRAHEKV